jgi:hypothetical protein
MDPRIPKAINIISDMLKKIDRLNQSGVTVTQTVDNVDQLLDRVAVLTNCDVLVGVPAQKTGRQESGPTNAMLAYVHEFGSPLKNIPARPFLIPGVRKAANQITAVMAQGAHDVMTGKQQNPLVVLNKAGMIARNSVVDEITDPEPPFVPLKPATIRARLRKTAAGRRKLRGLKKIGTAAGWSGTQSNQALSVWAGERGNIHPLIDTGQLRAAITYVIRPGRGSSAMVGGRRDTKGSTVITALNLNQQQYRRRP